MQDVFTLVGIVCALMLSFGVLLVGVSALSNRDYERKYRGLLDQIMDASSDVTANLKNDETLCATSVRYILSSLHQRVQPNILDVIANDQLWRSLGK